MNKVLPLIFVFAATTALAQPQTSQPNPPTTPAQSDIPFSPRGLPASPVNSGLPASAVNPGLPGFTNWIGPWFTNGVGTNFVAGDFSALMLSLQNNMQQLLPILAAMNGSLLENNTNLTNLGGTNLAGTTNAGTAVPNNNATRVANGALLSRDLSTRLSQDLSTRVGSTTTTLPNTPATPTSINGTNTSVLMASAANAPVGFAAGAGTNTLVLTSAQQDAVRALIVLQNDLERTLPIVASLNGGALPGLQTAFGTNNLGTVRSFLGTNNIVPTAPGALPGSSRLVPTGRQQ